MRWYSEATAARIDAAVKDIVDAAFAHARAILEANRALLDETAHALLKQETLSGPALAEIAGRVKRDVSVPSGVKSQRPAA
jgi:cell division protease FtsH